MREWVIQQVDLKIHTVQVGMPESSVATLMPLSKLVTRVSGTFKIVCSYVAARVDRHLLLTRTAVQGACQIDEKIFKDNTVKSVSFVVLPVLTSNYMISDLYLYSCNLCNYILQLLSHLLSSVLSVSKVYFPQKYNSSKDNLRHACPVTHIDWAWESATTQNCVGRSWEDRRHLWWGTERIASKLDLMPGSNCIVLVDPYSKVELTNI